MRHQQADQETRQKWPESLFREITTENGNGHLHPRSSKQPPKKELKEIHTERNYKQSEVKAKRIILKTEDKGNLSDTREPS